MRRNPELLTLKEGLTEQQRAELCGLQRSTDEAEEAITHGFDLKIHRRSYFQDVIITNLWLGNTIKKFTQQGSCISSFRLNMSNKIMLTTKFSPINFH